MIEFASTLIITVGSVLLFVYWFHYTCRMILSAKTTRDYACEVASANQLCFLEVRARLQQGASDLDRLRHSLDRDYAVLAYLLKHAASPFAGQSALETTMLGINYRAMRMWYEVTRGLSPQSARQALNEMSMVVAHFANLMGERAVAGSAA